jgi:hypothetical protein
MVDDGNDFAVVTGMELKEEERLVWNIEPREQSVKATEFDYDRSLWELVQPEPLELSWD